MYLPSNKPSGLTFDEGLLICGCFLGLQTALLRLRRFYAEQACDD